MHRIGRILRNILVVTFLLVATIVVLVLLIDDSRGCDTSICCTDCNVIAVARVIDGDTLVEDKSFRRDKRVRLYGVDTPEVGERCYVEATDRLIELAEESVRVEPGPREKDVYGRNLFYLYTEYGESIDEILVREGLGVAWTKDGQHRDIIVEVERQAKSAGTGCLW